LKDYLSDITDSLYVDIDSYTTLDIADLLIYYCMSIA